MLVVCKECGLQVSTKASFCPHCGCPQKGFSENPTRGKSRIRLPNGFGQITKLKNKNLRNPYRAMVTVGKDPNGRPICKILKPTGYFRTYNDAYAALVEYNKSPYDFDTLISTQELYDLWTAEYFSQITDASTRTIKAAWSYCEDLYSIPAKNIRIRHIKSVIDKCNKPSLKNRIKSVFNLMFDFAMEREIVDHNYARDFKTETIENAEIHTSFTTEEIETLWQFASIPFVNIILYQCYSGWRPQELCRLKLKDVDLNKNIITGGMKTKAGKNRIVPIPEALMSTVKKIYAMSEMLGCEYFICSQDGTPMTYDKYNKRFRKTMRDLGLSDHKPHDPRKHFITMCKSAGVDEYAIKRLVGHSIDDITERIYTDRDEAWLRNEIEKIQI